MGRCLTGLVVLLPPLLLPVMVHRWLQEMICDRTMNGQPLPDNVKLIAACNPYRLRIASSLYGGACTAVILRS